jgi:cytoskeleton protein RodZ
MARPDCPRCGSDLVAVALPDSPSEWVEELRGGSTHPHPVADRDLSWLCRACGHRWQPPDASDLEGAAAEEPDHDPPMREYAELLKLGPERTFATAGGESTLKELPARGRRRSVVGAVMTLAAIAAVVVLALEAPRSSTGSDLPEPSDAPTSVRGSGPVTPSPSPEPERRGVRAVLDAEQPCWVQVVADGEIVDSVTLQPGDTAVYSAKRDLQLRLGNAGGVTLRVNGDPIPTGGPGNVVVLDLSWRRGEVEVARA